MARAIGLSNASAVNRAKKPAAPKKSLGYDFPAWDGPPPGSYDPGIKSQVETSERGLLDLIEEQQRKTHREGVDVGQDKRLLHRGVVQGVHDIARQRGYAEADAANADQGYRTSFARDLADLATARTQGTQDYEKTLGQLQQKYANQTAVQAQSRVATGTNDQGTTAASEAVDSANKAYEKGGVDQAHQRNEEALNTRQKRDEEDLSRQLDLSGEGLGRALTEAAVHSNRLHQEAQTKKQSLLLGQGRNDADRGTELSRAKREQALYAQDEAEQAYYQAHQLNPKIVFPTPASAGGAKPAVPKPISPAIAPAIPVTAPRPIAPAAVAQSLHQPHVQNPVASGFGRQPARSTPLGIGRRPYTRF